MEDFHLFDKVIDGKANYLNNEAKVSEFIDSNKRWKLDNLMNYILADIIDKISCIAISITNIEDKLACKFS